VRQPIDFFRFDVKQLEGPNHPNINTFLLGSGIEETEDQISRGGKICDIPEVRS
jgi:hypothetical protein